MVATPSVPTRVLAIPTSANLSLTPPPPPPPPPPLGSPDDESDDGSDDGDHSKEPTSTTGFKPPQLSAPNTIMVSSSLLSSSPSTLPRSTASLTSTALAVSSISSSSAISEITSNEQTTLVISTTIHISKSSASSSSSRSDDNESISASTSSILSKPSSSILSQSSAATALPIGQPDSSLETKVGSSPLGTAGISLAAVFGFIALSTTIYLLYRLRRRREKQNSPRSDSEKQYTYTSTAQETGVIFGRRGSNSRTSSSPHGQHEGQIRGTGGSRFSFLNRRWYSTGSQFSASQQQQQQVRNPQSSHNTTTTDNDNNHEISTTSPRWPSPFFFALSQNPNLRTSSRTNSQYYPPNALPQTPQTATTITRLTTDIQRNISTRTTDSDASQAGSGHARAYAHHGIRAPQSAVISAARTTISSISSRWTRTRQRNSRVSSFTPSPRNMDTDKDRDNISSPVSEISDLYHGDTDRSSHLFPPQKHRLSSSAVSDRPLRTQTVPPSRWSSSESGNENNLGSSRTPSVNRPYSHDHRTSRARFTDIPRLPLPVAVSRGSWGSKIGV